LHSSLSGPSTSPCTKESMALGDLTSIPVELSVQLPKVEHALLYLSSAVV